MYVGFCFGWVFPCSSSEQKPSLRQRHRLLASNAESRIRLIVLLTAPKIFAISSITDKNSCRNFARLSAWYFRLGGTPTPDLDKSVKFKIPRGILSMQSDIFFFPCHSERIEESSVAKRKSKNAPYG